MRAVQLGLGGTLFNGIDKPGGSSNTDVGGDKQLFKLFPDLFADNGAVEEGHGSAEPGIAGALQGFLKNANGQTS